MPTAPTATTATVPAAPAVAAKKAPVSVLSQAHTLLKEEERIRHGLMHHPVVEAIGAGANWLDHRLFHEHPKQRYGVGMVTGAFLGGLFVSALSRPKRAHI